MEPEKYYLNFEDSLEKKIIAIRNSNWFGKKNLSSSWDIIHDFKEYDKNLIDNDSLNDDNTTINEGINREHTYTLKFAPVTNIGYTVKAKKGEGTSINSFEKSFETWRKVYYDVVYMDDRCKSLYEGVKDSFIKSWEDVGFELEESALLEATKKEDQTDRNDKGGAKMKHLYTENLENKDFHVQFVIVRDIVETSNNDVSWQMDKNTNSAEKSLIKISSTNNVIHYESPIQSYKQMPVRGSVAIIDCIEVFDKNEVIERIDDTTIAINMIDQDVGDDNDIKTLADIHKGLIEKKIISINTILNGKKAKVQKFKLVLDVNKLTDIQIGTTTFTVTVVDKRVIIQVTDMKQIWSNSPCQEIKFYIQYKVLGVGGACTTTEQKLFNDSAIERVNSNTFKIIFSDFESAVSIINGKKMKSKDKKNYIQLILELSLQSDVVAVQQEIDTQISNKNTDVIYFDHANSRILIKKKEMVFDTDSPLTAIKMSIVGEYLQIPNKAITLTKNKKINLDLDKLDNEYKSIKEAFEAEKVLKFKLRVDKTQSIGGYNMNNFIAITAKKMSSDERDETTIKRIRLCMMHELGHAHDIVQKKDNYPNNGRGEKSLLNSFHYTDSHGGHGPHCNYNAKLVPSGASHGHLSTTSGQIYKHNGNKGDKLCLMYHSLDLTNMGDSFCPTCTNHLQAQSKIKFT